jgi:hypothetical protein
VEGLYSDGVCEHLSGRRAHPRESVIR